ncbi:putative mitochondrial ferredoxin, 2fe-2s-like protein [Leptomonas pyrrhocoris]|uniref:Putative mitochondrial ferredoxin, 2fe-2s-like protein n=1 Tax=Leptomonas pyrrhocoris TaxID=157538 RepID=A0A0M9FRB0_LEPPY|nr:putative mitochondrial ferredoxin, 2fe-2s-like protein [Leptomonas pyrrhocoris]XP_015652899.1 putative mitochondrial ferredoxin, 2fe-2s-like protein [Leptomonas pyrrhocoris]KPA74459.1 putative mitochondrial ferredoxin, 2fe-2s-like protein [Leptomonas pyrrhocoris]KPA74460.1 putative mitochondrial ferredoxin, 2fe-2s-like protein [Leptomonas pyrrhocoris]|eukprot:XP_015652898.1 putative mitochondrial ferredoxin, 2fe-2s-like protein [Leptomonas pyrrhocoris]
MRRLTSSLSSCSRSVSPLFTKPGALLGSSLFYRTPGKIKVNITVQDGTQFDFSTPTGISLMEAIRDVAQLDMDVSCLKKMRCSICHAYVMDGWYEKLPPPSEEELDTLDKALDPKETSRLSCQVQLTEKEDGIVVVLPKHTVDLTAK